MGLDGPILLRREILEGMERGIVDLVVGETEGRGEVAVQRSKPLPS
jgi:hypothetical protein